ncbi:hypothetical protein COO60DRAFT_656194 [Scenedesmus sp. NREL 46B-D3]|nr:hypothetical protein COO60DRAFT_656194 [Scenedesmus sp. NREL 46B-D3]
MLLLLRKRPVLLDTGRKAQCILPPLHATVTPNPALDILMNSQRMSLLDHADQELAKLCSSKATAEEQAMCWEVWRFYHDRRQAAQSGCRAELQAGSAAAACQTLDNLEKLVYEVAYTGDAEQLYHMLKIQNNMEKKHVSASSSQVAEIAGRQSVLEAAHAKAAAMFSQLDADGNGVIDREEFLSGMSLLHHALGDHEMELALGCMDSHGYITPEQFVGIVAAEEVAGDEASDAAFLRSTSHARPAWWSDAPSSIMDV